MAKDINLKGNLKYKQFYITEDIYGIDSIKFELPLIKIKKLSIY